MIKYSGQTISGMHYSGYTIVRAYGCGGELVFGTAPPTPTGTKVIYTISGTSYTIPCDYDPQIDKMEILQDMSRKGLPIQDETSAMTDVVIGDCVTTISANTFNECEAVTSFTISNSVTTIGHDAFKDCIVLPSITLPSGITTIADALFENDFQLSAVTIPSGVTSIGESAFYDNISLLNIEIPSGVTSIGMGAFRCSNWTNPQWKRDKMLQVASGRSVTIYATVPPTLEQGDEFSIYTGSDDIATYPIYVPCESVDAYKTAWSQYASRIQCIPPTVETKWLATYSDSHTESAECDSSSAITSGEINKTNLTSIEIGDCVATINTYAFGNYTSLTSVTIGSGVTSIGNQAFYYCSGLTEVNIPNSVTSIGDYAFNRCFSLSSITINCSSIGVECFYLDSGLTSVTLSDSVRSIGDRAFSGCTSLTSITIPSGVTSIGGAAFRYCSSLTNITVLATTPPALGSRAFDNTNNCPIYVPAESVNAYKTANGWSQYSSRIQPIP